MKEYKAITGNSVTLTKDGDVKILAQSVSRLRHFVQAHQLFKISGIKEEPGVNGSEERSVDNAIRNFLDLANNNKRPQNDTRKKG